MLVNAMITRSTSTSLEGSFARSDGIAFLDLDPGQPEFSPPGELSLVHLRSCILGPPFTHPSVEATNGKSLIRAHHYGGLSPKNRPEYYMKCAKDLFDRYRDLLMQFPSCRLVVNCAGWIQGTGLEVLLDLIHLRRLTDIVYTSTRGPQEVVEALIEAANTVGAPSHLLSSQGSDITTRTAADFRVTQTLSYFHLDEPEAGNLRWSSTTISEQVPLVVHWAGDQQALFAVMVLNDEIDPDMMTIILEGCIVGLVVIEDDQAIPDGSKLDIVLGRRDEQDGESEGIITDEIQQPHSSYNSPETHPGTRPLGKSPTSIQHLEHPLVARNSVGMPYIAAGRRFASPLDPRRSYSLGQAIVRGIDTESQCFHLVSPVSSTVLAALHHQKAKIVLVRGNMDTPTWAAREDWEKGAALRRWVRKQDPNAADRFDAEDARDWADRRPYVSATDDRVKSASARVWRVRRDLKPRASGDDTD